MTRIADIAKKLADWGPDGLMVAGAVAVSGGIGLVYPPAGVIVSGLFLLAAGWLLARGR